MEITVVTISQICSACHIVEGVVREMMLDLSRLLPEIHVEWVVFDNPADAIAYPSLEMVKFPAIFYKGEQMTAGTIPSLRELVSWMEEENG